MARFLLLFLSFMLLGGTAALGQTSIGGQVTDSETGEPLLLANVVLKKNGVFITGTQTDFDGIYSMTSLDPGTYEVEVTYVGYATLITTDVLVGAGRSNKLDIKMTPEGELLDEVIVVGYKIPLIEQDNTTSGGGVTAEQIARLPSKSINGIATNVAGVASADEGDDLNFRGSRSNGTDYYIDGIRVSGNLIPQTEIEQLQVITGGIGAQYGDVTGGIISITTKGPSERFTGGFEVESSYGLDPYGYLLGVANLSGPLLRKRNEDGTKGRSLLGFRISGQYRSLKDDDAPAIPVYSVTDEVLAELQANPMTLLGSIPTPAASFLDFDDVDELDFRPNEENTRYDLTAKLDARLSSAIDVSFTGSYNYEKDYFTPSGSSSNANASSWRVFNSQNNPFDTDLRYRGNVRLRHRLGGANASSGDEADSDQKASLIQNASYTLQAGYERRQYNLSDPTHGENFFDYGYIGKFDYEYVPTIQNAMHVDYSEILTGYTPGTQNPVLANYNNVLGDDITSTADLVTQNGFTSSVYSQVWNLHANVGTVYNLHRKRDDEILTFTANSNFEIVPRGKGKGRHSVEFGVWFEQRTNRGYDLNPYSLWQIGRQQVNRNILGVDTSNVIGDTTIFNVTIPIYGVETTDQEDLLFYKRIREATNTPFDEYVNIDGLDPDQLSLDMFSAFELTNQNILTYYGYDYLGNIQNDVTFDDFFTATDANGIRTFPVAAQRPIYAAAYIQDKFTFKDIIVRAGLRIDRFDANTRVLKDPYALYEIQNAADFHSNLGSDRPETIGDDFKVYVESEGSNSVKAYRDGDQWYFANGTQANDGRLIFGGELVFPKYTVDDPNIQSRDFDPSVSFEDYEQQTNFMPRLAFSFPISENANFFAHYDVLVQRPPSNNIFTPLDYFYFQERSGIKNNANLKPERTVDYEVGFQQKISNSSAIKIAAYYKELRDMIQSRTFLFVAAPINSYETFDNLDFGTVKGFTFQYDLRRTGNISLLAAYTLQFADGTGSDAESSRGLSNRGVQRVLYPLSFDERHRLNLALDYRFTSGKSYNGPRIGGVDILAKTGLNVQAIAVSGRPYTSKQVPSVLGGAGTVGSINGSRLPWNFTINARLDKDFSLGGPDRPLNFNVYFRVSNVLDARNIINVYPVSGSPEDDGYLASSFGIDAIQSAANSGRSADAYLASYQWRMLNPTFFSLPRRMFVGLIFNL